MVARYELEMKDLPTRLRELRQARGLRQQDVADALGVSVGTINKWETYVSGVQVGRVEEWAEALGLEVEVLVRPKDLKKRKLTRAQEDALRRILAALPWVEDSKLGAIVATVEALQTEHPDDPGEGLLWARQYPGSDTPPDDV